MSTVSTVSNPAGVINIETAPEQELRRLPGVGPALARRIVAWRARNGGFGSVDELSEVRGIGEGRLEALRPYLVASPPVATPVQAARRRGAPRARTGPVGYVRRNLESVAVIGLALVGEALIVALAIWVF